MISTDFDASTQDPEQLTQGDFPLASPGCKLALSPDSEVLAVSAGPDVHLFSTGTAKELGVVSAPHSSQHVSIKYLCIEILNP